MPSRAALSALLLSSFAAVGLTLVREHVPRSSGRAQYYAQHAHQKRQETVAFPPVLNENEQVLIDSFNSTAIETYNYYYTHGNHLGGLNRSMAEWTAERWAENGFDTYLATYSKLRRSYHFGKDAMLITSRRLPQLPSFAFAVYDRQERVDLHCYS